MKTRKDIVGSREVIFREAIRRHTFNKGDRRVHTPRVCVVCGRPLSSLVLSTQAYITIHRHTRFHLSDVVIVDMCTDVSSCYRVLRQKGELIEDVDDE